MYTHTYSKGFPGGPSGRVSTCQSRRWKRCGFSPWFRKIPWRRKWHPTPGFLPGKSHGQRSLVGYSPWGRKESDTTERLHFHFPPCFLASQVALVVKSRLPVQEMQETWGDPWLGKISWGRRWHPTPGFLPGKSHGQRGLVGYSLWGRKTSDTIE